MARERALVTARRQSAAVLGFTSAIAAYGSFFIPRSFGTAISRTGGPEAAFLAFIAFYATCMVITWWCYLRRSAQVGKEQVLAEAGA